MFELIQASYELLLPVVESGETIKAYEMEGGGDERVSEGFSGGRSQMDMMLLLIKAQLLICRRYEKQMSRYRYPAYRILLYCIALPNSCSKTLVAKSPSALLDTCLLLPQRAEFMLTASRLIFRTCLVSPLNSEALVEESGVPVLIDLISFYTEVVLTMQSHTSPRAAPIEEILDTLSELIHTLSGVAFFETGIVAITEKENLDTLLICWRRCLDGTISADKDGRDILIRRYALEGIANMAKNAPLRDRLVGAGVIWPMVRMVLSFDPTLDSTASSVGEGIDDLGVSVASNNVLARLSVRGLGLLAGMLDDYPENKDLQEGLSVLLTSQIARMLRNRRTSEILRTLNSNVEKANIIWNVGMRYVMQAVRDFVGHKILLTT